MIVVEILVGIIIATVVLTMIGKIGAPLAEAFADRLKLKYQEMGTDSERKLKSRITALEEEVHALRQQVITIRETADFAVKCIESGKLVDRISLSEAEKIEIKPKKEKR
jgi:hypothetical protein